jgi:hypothetical protein
MEQFAVLHSLSTGIVVNFLVTKTNRPMSTVNTSSCTSQLSDLIPETPSLLQPTTQSLCRTTSKSAFSSIGRITLSYHSFSSQCIKVPANSLESVVMVKPILQSNYEQLEEAEQAQVMQEYHQRQFHLLCLCGTTRFNPEHIDTYLTEEFSL